MLRSKHQVPAQSGESRSCILWTPHSRDYVKGTSLCCLPQSPLSMSEPFLPSLTLLSLLLRKPSLPGCFGLKDNSGSRVSTSASEAQKCSQKHCRVAVLPQVPSLPHPCGSDDWDSRLKLPGRDFPGDPVAKNPPSNAGGVGSIPGSGTKIPHATRTPKEANR